jgi:hypothetical protein
MKIKNNHLAAITKINKTKNAYNLMAAHFLRDLSVFKNDGIYSPYDANDIKKGFKTIVKYRSLISPKIFSIINSKMWEVMD